MDDTPQTEIRRIIFENFNDADAAFTNDAVLEELKKRGGAFAGLTADDSADYFDELCRSGAARKIGENFTTIYMKLFEPLAAVRCGACGIEVYRSPSEGGACIRCGES